MGKITALGQTLDLAAAFPHSTRSSLSASLLAGHEPANLANKHWTSLLLISNLRGGTFHVHFPECS